MIMLMNISNLEEKNFLSMLMFLVYHVGSMELYTLSKWTKMEENQNIQLINVVLNTEPDIVMLNVHTILNGSTEKLIC